MRLAPSRKEVLFVLLTLLVFLMVGILAGTFGSLVGLGGGVIIVPCLLLLSMWFPFLETITPQVAVGTSLFVVIVTALSSTLAFAKQKRVDFQAGWLFFATSGPASVLGSWINRYASFETFLIFFGILLIFLSVILNVRDRMKPRRIHWHVTKTYTDFGETVTYGYNRWLALFVSFFVGLVAGLFGIGGGVFLVPMMVLFFLFPPHLATATSMFTILLTSVMGSVSHIAMGNVNWWLVLALAPGAWLGAQLGAYISARMTGKRLLLVARLALALVGVDMIVEGIW